MEGNKTCEKTPELEKWKRRSECSDEEEEGEKNARLAVEEALSSSKIQTCPHCGRRAIKSAGCDNVVCVCNNSYCFRCGEDVLACDLSWCQNQFPRPGLISILRGFYPLPHPQLTIELCCRIVAGLWTDDDDDEEEEEEVEWGGCDNDPLLRPPEDGEEEWEEEEWGGCDNDPLLRPPEDGEEEWEECER